MRESLLFLSFSVLVGLIFFFTRDTHYETVARVIDGDTIELSTGEKLRFERIDAPEVATKCGQRAKTALERIFEAHSVRVERKGTDKYGRTLARVYLKPENRDVEEMMVNLNLAVFYEGQKADPNICN